MTIKTTQLPTAILITALSFICLGTSICAGYYYKQKQDNQTIANLNTQISSDAKKIASLTPNNSGLFDPKTASIGEKTSEGNWQVSSKDSDGTIHLSPITSPAVITGVFDVSLEGGVCMSFEQPQLESGTLPTVVGLANSTFCTSSNTSPAIISKFGAAKSHNWATVEINNLTYGIQGAIADITKVDSITPLESDLTSTLKSNN